MPQHSESLAIKWTSFSKQQQILMIATEIARAHTSLKIANQKEVDSAYLRTIELLDLTTADTKWTYTCKELLRLKEMIGSAFTYKNATTKSNQDIYRMLLMQNSQAYNLLDWHLK